MSCKKLPLSLVERIIMFNVTKYNRGHLYDPQCRCRECVSYELELQDMIRSESKWTNIPSSEMSRPVSDKTFKPIK